MWLPHVLRLIKGFCSTFLSLEFRLTSQQLLFMAAEDHSLPCHSLVARSAQLGALNKTSVLYWIWTICSWSLSYWLQKDLSVRWIQQLFARLGATVNLSGDAESGIPHIQIFMPGLFNPLNTRCILVPGVTYNWRWTCHCFDLRLHKKAIRNKLPQIREVIVLNWTLLTSGIGQLCEKMNLRHEYLNCRLLTSVLLAVKFQVHKSELFFSRINFSFSDGNRIFSNQPSSDNYRFYFF